MINCCLSNFRGGETKAKGSVEGMDMLVGILI